MYYIAAMRSRLSICVIIVLLLAAFLVGCARDTNEEDAGEKYPIEVTMRFTTLGSLDPKNWYYMVFNFTAAPSVTAATSPIDLISDVDRGKNWELYVAINPSNVSSDSVVTLQRPSLPTVLPTETGPVDVASATINNDSLIDLVVASREAGTIEVFSGKAAEAYETEYYTESAVINLGPQPVRVFADQFIGEAGNDLVVLFAGEDGSSPFLRLMEGDGAGTLTVLEPDIQLAGGIPIDVLAEDFNNDQILDLALITSQDPGGTGELTVLLGNGTDGFSPQTSITVGTDPVQVSAGQLNDSGTDLAVACRGAAGTNGEIHLFNGADNGSFTANPVSPLQTPGGCTGAVIAQMLKVGTDPLDDVLAGYVDATGQGMLRVFLNNVAGEGETLPPDEVFGTYVVDTESMIQPDYIAAADTSDDGRVDALVLNGAPGAGGNTFMIQRGSIGGEGSEFLFEWDPEPITYISGLEPSRIHLDDIDGNGFVDVITPNSADDEAGNSIALFYGLGKDNFTSVDIYWTDELPEQLVFQDWYINHVIGPNYFELTIDPALFYDMARRQPEDFIVDFMTTTSAIDLINNINQDGSIYKEGIVVEHLSQAISVPMTIGFYNDEQNSPRANAGAVADPAEDIVDWRIEVF